MVELVNRQQVASHCEVSLPTVDAWVRKGCPFVTRGSKGTEWQFDLAAVEKWLAQYWSRPTQVVSRYGTRTFSSTDRAEMVKAMGHLIAHVGSLTARKAIEAGSSVEIAFALEQGVCIGLSRVGEAYLSERGIQRIHLVDQFCTIELETDFATLAASVGKTYDYDACQEYLDKLEWFMPTPEAEAEGKRIVAEARAAREASEG